LDSSYEEGTASPLQGGRQP
jgi:ankyrin repeat protein